MQRMVSRHLFIVCALGLNACGNVQEKTIDAPPTPVDSMASVDAATECVVGALAMCDAANLVVCDGQGNITATVPCTLGCEATEARCKKVDPSNSLAPALDESAGASDLVLVGNATIDTDAETVVDSTGTKAVLKQTLSSGVPVPIFIVKAKSITTGPVRVVGSKALALVADGPITFDGNISLDAIGDQPGPGAITNQPACSGGTSGAGTSNGYPGGGGGGFGTAGGKGGDAVGQIGGTGGGVVGNAELVPLRGGCSGGEGQAGTPDGDPLNPDPGGGGGALQVVSNTSIIVGTGVFVSANGAGGKTYGFATNCFSLDPCGLGEGGGSGGAILFEAPIVSIDSTGGIVANGGAGTCERMGSAASGSLSAQPALGATCGGETGKGGNGAAGVVAAEAGGNGSGDDPVGGGGGGGVGRIRINLPADVQLQTAAVLSPAPSLGIVRGR